MIQKEEAHKFNDEHELRHNHSQHSPDSATSRGALLFSFFLITGFMIVEFVGGLLTHSLTLLSDSGHMLSDSISLGLSFVAMAVGARVPANSIKTFGYRRFEILAALFNGVLLLVISAWIVIEALLRLRHPAPIMGSEMLLIAVIGFIVNLIVAAILMRGESKKNLNIRSALLHVLGDLLGSAGAIAAALIIIATGWQYADPAASILVSLLIFRSGWQIVSESINILMESRPSELNVDEIRGALANLSGVVSVHDLHIWTITSGFFSLSCHLTVTDHINRDELLYQAEELLGDYNLQHATIQMEGQNFAGCRSDCTHEKRIE
ncbi:cation diffusion facilitator family transporter [Sporolactobacillus spathodeae]|uniref:Cobalt-zinc-cadmium efflux system protein n=1 Tax=Sporolactobacillus spathodeae TaxID=1465502 RepID=A0ABS2Q8V1_9BACL|nr:cation diffusion facilitator family transporter [Sporolactobacillus spathodeae]MBM7657870.1 cobalt-zinc-cadmium efflux system protein [Sporolactobacillus spathodeae]